MRVEDTLAFAAGSWRVERSVTDHRTGTRGTFTGVAEFAPRPGEPGMLTYSEHGELRFGTHTGPASRQLLLVGAADGSAQVRFADGRPFYPLDLRRGEWRAEHLCGRDRYQVSYRVPGPGRIEERWQARGPDKRYDMETVLTRLDERGAESGS